MNTEGPTLTGTFDYVIVGAGTAGCILAARLAENPGIKVAILEAGTASNPLVTQVPLAFGKAVSSKSLTWQFRTEPEAALDGRQLVFPRGRLLGGTSAINGMVHTRGFPADFDGWAELGCNGWSYAEVEGYFDRAERRLSGRKEGNIPQLGSTPPIATAFIEACASDDQLQYAPALPPHVAIQNGRRLSPAHGLQNARGPNLMIFKDCRVDRVLIRDGRAYGVRAMHAKRHVDFNARAEVLLCAGSIQSPNLLFHSGIGDGETLRESEIPVVHHLPGVGRNLQDHFGVTLAWEARNTETINALLRNRFALMKAVVQWTLSGSGPFARPLAEVLLFSATDKTTDHPDVELILRVMNGSSERGLPPTSAFSFTTFPLRPQSRGSLRPSGNAPSSPPIISPNYLSAHADIETSLRAIKLARRLVQTEQMRPFTQNEILPGEGVESDQGLLDYLKRTGSSASHHVGSCRMGNDHDAVVDPELRVKGIASLRVVDGSVMPVLPSAHPNAAVMMIAEKAGDIMTEAAR